jgi:hypothetical protein
MELLDSALVQCPYCGEQVELELESAGPSRQEYVEDCSVCCRPWKVRVTRDEDQVDVQLLRDDD